MNPPPSSRGEPYFDRFVTRRPSYPPPPRGDLCAHSHSRSVPHHSVHVCMALMDSVVAASGGKASSVPRVSMYDVRKFELGRQFPPGHAIVEVRCVHVYFVCICVYDGDRIPIVFLVGSRLRGWILVP